MDPRVKYYLLDFKDRHLELVANFSINKLGILKPIQINSLNRGDAIALFKFATEYDIKQMEK